ncbi:DNA repair protein RecO [Candidatus Nomurabacteria bacterium]|nr:DNA repair protein RecO [Candidatus Nomurabacteria bacterium]
MHHIYHTEGIILEGKGIGEANKYFLIFTKDLGMIRASAQNVRSVSSKLRFSLQDFSYSKISLVRGKDYWRITNAELIFSIFQNFKDNKIAFKLLANVLGLLKRMLKGEEPNEKLFLIISSFLDFLNTTKITRDELASAEYILVLRVLKNLGYVDAHLDLADMSVGQNWNLSIISTLDTKRKEEIIRDINKAIKESQL